MTAIAQPPNINSKTPKQFQTQLPQSSQELTMPVKKSENIAIEIADLEEKIACLQEQLATKTNQADQKPLKKQIKLLENKLNQLHEFNELSVGDWVCNVKPDSVGQISQLKKQNELYEVWVLWENDRVPTPSSPSTLTKQNPDLFLWDWNNDHEAIIREFDHKPCDDFATLLDFIETFQSSFKKTYEQSDKDEILRIIRLIHEQWKQLVFAKFPQGERVKYDKLNATIHEHEYMGSLLCTWIKFDDGEFLIVTRRWRHL